MIILLILMSAATSVQQLREEWNTFDKKVTTAELTLEILEKNDHDAENIQKLRDIRTDLKRQRALLTEKDEGIKYMERKIRIQEARDEWRQVSEEVEQNDRDLEALEKYGIGHSQIMQTLKAKSASQKERLVLLDKSLTTLEQNNK